MAKNGTHALPLLKNPLTIGEVINDCEKGQKRFSFVIKKLYAQHIRTYHNIS